MRETKEQPRLLGIGLLGGLTGILCCVGPTVLALYGVTTWLGTFA